MNNEIKTIKAALDRCRELLEANPQFPPLLSVETQLKYLVDIIEGKISYRSRLDEIIVGRYAAREFEDRDMEFANKLYEVVEIVTAMRE